MNRRLRTVKKLFDKKKGKECTSRYNFVKLLVQQLTGNFRRSSCYTRPSSTDKEERLNGKYKYLYCTGCTVYKVWQRTFSLRVQSDLYDSCSQLYRVTKKLVGCPGVVPTVTKRHGATSLDVGPTGTKRRGR